MSLTGAGACHCADVPSCQHSGPPGGPGNPRVTSACGRPTHSSLGREASTCVTLYGAAGLPARRPALFRRHCVPDEAARLPLASGRGDEAVPSSSPGKPAPGTVGGGAARHGSVPVSARRPAPSAHVTPRPGMSLSVSCCSLTRGRCGKGLVSRLRVGRGVGDAAGGAPAPCPAVLRALSGACSVLQVSGPGRCIPWVVRAMDSACESPRCG